MNDSSTKRSKPVSTYVKLAVFTSLCIPLLLLVWNNQKKIEEVNKDLEFNRALTQRSTEELAKLNKAESELKNIRQEGKAQGARLKQIASWCMDPEDFWKNESNLCVAVNAQKHHMNDMIRLLLPQGNHTLRFKMQRIPRDEKGKPTGGETKTKELEYSLSGPAAYEIILAMPREEKKGYRDPRELLFRIRSSDPDFVAVEQPLLEYKIPPPSGSSTSFGLNAVFYPNEYGRLPKDAPKGVEVNRMTWHIAPKDRDHFGLKFEMRLVSDGPPLVPYNEAFFLRHRDKPPGLNYLGDGSYELLPAE